MAATSIGVYADTLELQTLLASSVRY